MSKGIESVLVTKQETIVLLRAKPTIVKGVLVAIKVRHREPNLISRVETLLKESQGVGVEEFIVWIEFQDLTFYDAYCHHIGH